MVCNAIKNQSILDECFGSHPEHQAIQVSLSRCLVSDVAHQQKSTLAVTSVDCLSCYNNVGHPTVSLACQCLGIPQSILCMVFSTIQMMKFFLHTAHGDSNTFYGGGTLALPFQGVCQGNGAGLAIWLAVSIILMDMGWSNGYTPTFSTLITCLSISLLGLIYIDDCHLFAIDLDGLHPNEVVCQLQTNINLWQDGLMATGDLLSPKKSSWCLLSMIPCGHQWSYHTASSFPLTLTMHNASSQPIPIHHVNPQEGISTVGVVQALSVNQKPALLALQSKANEWEGAFC